jgi:glycosyltransferase involved in cell wall biosynthesis
MPRVSTLIPARNAARSLPATLASIRDQDFVDWEAIVVDDASGDGTAAVAAGVDKRITVVRSQDQLGPAGARNLALEHASGRLIALLDADDRWLPGYLSSAVARADAAAEAGRRVGIFACDALIEDETGRTVDRWSERYGRPTPVRLTRLLRANTIFISSVVPRTVLDDVGPFSTECFGSEDHDLWLRIVEAGYEVDYSPEALAAYRLSGDTLSADRLGMARTGQATYRRALERGRLSPFERIVARRELRAQVATERLAMVRRAWEDANRTAAFFTAARSAPLVARVALERPERWLTWARGQPGASSRLS